MLRSMDTKADDSPYALFDLKVLIIPCALSRCLSTQMFRAFLTGRVERCKRVSCLSFLAH